MQSLLRCVVFVLLLATCLSLDIDGCESSAAYAEIMESLLDRGSDANASLVTMELEYAKDQIIRRAVAVALEFKAAYCAAP